LKDKLSSAILKLLNQRRLENLKEKWWNRNPEKKDCQDSKKQSDGISINNIGKETAEDTVCSNNSGLLLSGGVFIVIFIGVVLACITLVIEHWYYKGKETKVVSLANQADRSIPMGLPPPLNQNNQQYGGLTFSNKQFPTTDLNYNQQLILRQFHAKRDFNSYMK